MQRLVKCNYKKITDITYTYKLKYLDERNYKLPKKDIINIKLDSNNNVFTLMNNGDLYKNDLLYSKNCLHILELVSNNNLCDEICFIYENNLVEIYNYKSYSLGVKKYDKVLFGYNYLVTFKDKSLWLYTNILTNFKLGEIRTIELSFSDVDDCNIALEPVNLQYPNQKYDEEDCVELLELYKNSNKITVDLPCINLRK